MSEDGSWLTTDGLDLRVDIRGEVTSEVMMWVELGADMSVIGAQTGLVGRHLPGQQRAREQAQARKMLRKHDFIETPAAA